METKGESKKFGRWGEKKGDEKVEGRGKKKDHCSTDSSFLQLLLVESTRDNWDSVVKGETESHFPVPACDAIRHQGRAAHHCLEFC